MYVYSILNGTNGEIKEVKKIDIVHTNSVKFTDNHTSFKSDIREITDWLPNPKGDYVIDSEVLCLGYQDEMIIGYLDGDICEGEGCLLEEVTHWRPKPMTPRERKHILNKEI